MESSEKYKIMSKILKGIYGTESVGLRYENEKICINRKHGSLKKVNFENGNGNRFKKLFYYTFRDKNIRYSAECKSAVFDRANIFYKSLKILKEDFKINSNHMDLIISFTSGDELDKIGSILYDFYYVIVDCIFSNDSVDFNSIVTALNKKILNFCEGIQKINSLNFTKSYETSGPHVFPKVSEEEYLKRKRIFCQRASERASRDKYVGVSDMTIFYKSSYIRGYADIKDYVIKKELKLIKWEDDKKYDVDSETVYMYIGECNFKREKNNEKSCVVVTINLNGERKEIKTSEDRWENYSLIINYADENLSRNCVCYLRFDQGKIVQILQLGDD